jgi:N6-adenosine-specific RNA methylase IME4
MLPDAELRALADDIKANGLNHPIVMFGAHLLDGRNRWRACEIAGVEVKLRDWQGTPAEAVRFVRSENMKRRDLTQSQKAPIAIALDEMEAEAAGARMLRGTRDPAAILQQGRAAAIAADEVGVSERYVYEAKAIKKAAPELIEKVIAGTLSIPEAKALSESAPSRRAAVVQAVERGEAKNVRQAIQKLNAADRRETTTDEIKDGHFPVIYADPPWEYSNTGLGGNVADKYPTMPTDDICAMPVADKATSNAVLFLWATNPLLEDALRVVKAWGFEYKTNIAWTKTTQTTGFYCYGRHELLLICVRGACLPKPGSIGASHIHAATDEHSKKPDEFYALIERMYDGPYLEMFGRRLRKGWTTFGNEQAVKGAA